jgi:hypothetical protein
MLFMGDMGTQMTIQKIKSKSGISKIKEVMEELTEMFDEKDPRFESMSKYYPEERDLILRREIERK